MPKIHLNVAEIFPSKLKSVETGLCMLDVENPRISMIWDDMDMGFMGRAKLRDTRNICLACVEALPPRTESISYLFAFREKTKKELESVSVEGE